MAKFKTRQNSTRDKNQEGDKKAKRQKKLEKDTNQEGDKNL